MTIDELIQALERAEGPSRELDGEIYQTVDPVIVRCWPHWTREQRENLTPHYTSSIDSALSLVPEGWRVENLSQWDHPKLVERGEWMAQLMRSGGTAFEARCNHARTPALAMAIAALRATTATRNTE